METDYKVNSLNGYCFRSEDLDRKELLRAGVETLTAIKDIAEMEASPETLLERLLNAAFPGGGYNNTGDDYFVIRRGGVQYLVLVHAGQWFVGENAAVERTGELVQGKWDERRSACSPEEAKEYLLATALLMCAKGRVTVYLDPCAFDGYQDRPFCRTLEEPLFALSIPEHDPDHPERRQTLCASAENDGLLTYMHLDGSEDEDFDIWYGAVHRLIAEPGDPDEYEWLSHVKEYLRKGEAFALADLLWNGGEETERRLVKVGPYASKNEDMFITFYCESLWELASLCTERNGEDFRVMGFNFNEC